MRLKKILAAAAAVASIAVVANFAAAQSPNQPAATPNIPPGAAPQTLPRVGPGGGESTLEIAPRPGAISSQPNPRNVSPGAASQPGGVAPSEPGYSPNLENGTGNNPGNSSGETGGATRFGRRPYLGITVRYATKCYAGMEEHGLEVLAIDPNSPALRAGLKGRTEPNALGASGMTAGTMLGPMSALVNPLLKKAGAMGNGGDLIVAVDDRRVRSPGDLDDAMARIKPGDTMYLTVIRPLSGGGHQTLKIAVHVGTVGAPFSNAGGTE